YEVDDFDAALRQVRNHCRVGALTRSEHGSVVIGREEMHAIDAEPVDRLVDTTGAGDQYAAGFLYGLTHGHDLATCGRLGSMAAAEVISHFGARPAVSLAKLAEGVVRERRRRLRRPLPQSRSLRRRQYSDCMARRSNDRPSYRTGDRAP